MTSIADHDGTGRHPAAFPADWTRALVLVAHPDDAEYGMSAAVARWTDEGKTVEYVLGSSGEAGIQGIPADVCGPLREQEQRRAAAAVGVDRVDFLGFTDSALADTDELRDALAKVIAERQPELVLGGWSGDEWEPGAPNQSDHIEFGRAVAAAVARVPGTALFENGPGATHEVEVDPSHVERAVRSLREHEEYLRVLDPGTPVAEQARLQVESVLGDPPRVGFVTVPLTH